MSICIESLISPWHHQWATANPPRWRWLGHGGAAATARQLAAPPPFPPSCHRPPPSNFLSLDYALTVLISWFQRWWAWGVRCPHRRLLRCFFFNGPPSTLLSGHIPRQHHCRQHPPRPLLLLGTYRRVAFKPSWLLLASRYWLPMGSMPFAIEHQAAAAPELYVRYTAVEGGCVGQEARQKDEEATAASERGHAPATCGGSGGRSLPRLRYWYILWWYVLWLNKF